MVSKINSRLLSPTDKIITQILEVNMQSSQNDTIFDSQELKVLTDNKEKSFAGIGEYVGENTVAEALHLAISNTRLSIFYTFLVKCGNGCGMTGL